MSSLISVEKVSHNFAGSPALREISLSIYSNSYTVLLGPSGSGKTTLLSVLGGFLQPNQGRIFLNGEDITAAPPAKRPTATVFQDYALFPHMTVEANVSFGLRMRRTPTAQRKQLTDTALNLVGLENFAQRRPHQLSGGQRQRVALARALVIEPKALLLDEPLGALDLALRRQMQDELRATQRRVGAAFVHVTHDQEEAMALADQVVVMNAGIIEDIGPPERVYTRPASRFTARFMGESTVIEGKVTELRSKQCAVATTLGAFIVQGEAALGANVGLALRPEAIRVGLAEGGQKPLGEGRITEVIFQGGFKRVYIQISDGQTLLLKQPLTFSASEGELIPLNICERDLILLTR